MGSFALAGPLAALLVNPGKALASRAGSYGPLSPVADHTTGQQLLALPPGFEYWSFSPEGSPMVSGGTVPGKHDGMATFADVGGRVRLVRNHELGAGPSAPGIPAHDPNAAGGTTTAVWDTATKQLVEERHSLTGTIRNCAGGWTPWGSWLSCEETTDPNHGYIFEVPANGVSNAQPLRPMGRFAHEAVVVDPATGIVYETEDAGSTSGFYRFVPNQPGNLAAGGRLQMLALHNEPQYDTFLGQRVGRQRPVDWVDVPEPDGATTPFAQGRAAGRAAFRRLEGRVVERA